MVGLERAFDGVESSTLEAVAVEVLAMIGGEGCWM